MNDSIMRSIEKGTFMIRETKKRSEEIYVRIRLESKQIVKVNKAKEGSKKSIREDEAVIVDIAHIVDVRNSEDDSIFHKAINPLKSGINLNAKINLGFRFTIHHGLQFNLKTVSFRAPDTAQYFDWISGLKYLVEKYYEMPYETLVECWLWKHYYEIAESVTDSKIKGPVEIDDEFIIPAAFNKVISSSLGSLRDARDNGKPLDHRDVLSLNQEKQSKLKFKLWKTDANSSNMKRMKKQSTNNFRHFRRYSWCTNNSSTVDLSANMRFASLDAADCNKSIKSFNMKISPKQLTVWIAQQNGTKMPLDNIKEYNCNYPPKPNFIDFIGFVKIYKELFYQPEMFVKIIENRLKKAQRKSDFSSTKFKLKINTFKLSPIDLEWLELINNYFINYDFQNLDLDNLFSQSNSIWDPRRGQEVYQDMNQPLSAYYISTSHNSYLTGDQITSKSSCEAYTRCLQMGCRSVELDCWNGDKEPIIYHGNTLTSKIKLADVLQTIRKCAWQKSVYPIILSLEDHCSIPQQIIIAQMMQEIFQEDLLNGPVKTENSSYPNALPSPNQLKNKIILKHKKLPIDSLVKSESQNGFNDSTEDNQDNALLNYLFSGRMYMKDLFLDTWTPYYFLLTQARTLVYTEDTSVSDNDHVVNEMMPFHKPILQTDHSICDLRQVDNSSTFITIDQGETLSINCNGCIPSELTNKTKLPNWFYGSLSRMETNNWLLRYWFLGDGTFLIRTSESFPGNYSLSFYRKDKVHHVRICRFVDRFSHKISLGFEYCDIQFATMEDLITHYQENDMVALDFTIRLKNPPPERFQDSSWFYENPPVDLIAAEKILNKIPLVGSFLVTREKKQLVIEDSIFSNGFEQGRNFTEDHFILSYKGRGNAVVHNVIGYDGFQFTLFNQSSNSLVELVCYFFKNRLSDGVKLKYPADSNLIKKCKMLLKKSPSYPFSKEVESIMNQKNQEPPVHENDISICPSATANDLLSLHQDLDPELSLISDQMTTRANQTIATEAVTFKILETENGDVSNLGPLGNLEMGNFQLDSDCYVKIVNSDLNDFSSMMFAFDLYIVDFKIQLACETEQQRLDWINAISNCLDVNTENDMYLIRRRKEIQHKIAKPLSDLIIYCSSVPFSWPDNPEDFTKLLNSPCRDMSSISENRYIKLLSSKPNNDIVGTKGIHNGNNHNGFNEISIPNLHDFIEYHKLHLTRIYPKATRLDSSNLSPILPWLAGVQMVAINFQTPDRPSQLNQALFRDNGGCGFVLKDSSVFSSTQYLKVSLIFLGARHLPKITKGLLEIEVISLYDEVCDRKTFPLKSEFCVTDTDIPDIVFLVKNPNFAFIRFAFGSDEKLGQKKRLNSCQATFLVRGIRPGIRSVNLRNGFDYLHDLATLLFHVELTIMEAD